MDTLREIAGSLLLVSGTTIVAIAGLGVVRLADPFMRMHAATKAGVVGAGLAVLGTGLLLGNVGALITSMLAVVFLLLTSPIASHVLGRAAYISGAPLSPSTIRDALAGVLPRQISDISPARTIRRQRSSSVAGSAPAIADKPFTQESAMSIVSLRESGGPNSDSSAGTNQQFSTIKRITVWLVGGPAQPAASRLALDVARQSGAEVTALSAIDVSAPPARAAVPAGGIYWSSWLAGQQRLKSRATAANALSEFEVMAAETKVRTVQRHEEGDFSALAVIAAGCDLLLLPGGVNRQGLPCSAAEELASAVSTSGLGPTLRVSRRPLQVRRIGILIDEHPRSRRLAQCLVRTGLWRDSVVSVIAIGEDRPIVRDLLTEQTELLLAHGYEVRPASSLPLSCDVEDVQRVTSSLDVVVSRTLARQRPSGWFEALRTDVHAVAARNSPIVLLP